MTERIDRLRLRRSRPSETERIERRLVWILGGPRTGSTWLLDLLGYPLVPSAEVPSGVAMRPGGSGIRAAAIPINEPYLGVHLSPVVASGPFGVFTAADARGLQGPDPSYFFDERYAHAWRPQLRRLILDRIAAQADLAAREQGLDSPLIAVKEPNGSHAAQMITSTLPGSRVLFLLRDGRDVLDSLLDAVSPGGWLAGGPDSASVASADERIEFLKTNAWLWVHRITAVQRAVTAHPTELTVTVRYEDLRADAGAVLQRIVSRLGVDVEATAVAEAVAATSFEGYAPETKGRGKPLRIARPGHWRESMSEEEQAAIIEIMGEKLAELGYQS